MLDRELSIEVARRIRAARHACWNNACTALYECRELDAVYVEGWYVPVGYPVAYEHGWLELWDGRIVDPTLVLFSQYPACYFPALKRNREELPGPNVWLPLLRQNGGRGLKLPSYRQAYKAACRCALKMRKKRIR